MATLLDYQNNPRRVLIDAVADPSIRQFIDASEIELVSIDLGGGLQGQAQALKKGSVRDVIERIIKKAKASGADLKYWICSRSEFNLCAKLNTPVGELMHQLHVFLDNKVVQGGIAISGVVSLFGTPAIGAALTIFTALGFFNSVFIKLCNCPVRAKKRL